MRKGDCQESTKLEERLVVKICDRLDPLATRPDLIAAKDALTPWTRATKTALCRACSETFPWPLHIRVTQNHLEAGYAHLWAGGEFLYDVTCLKFHRDNGCLQKVHMVAEVEFNGRNAILADFPKLLMAGSGLRVMVHDHLKEVRFKELEPNPPVSRQSPRRYLSYCGLSSERGQILQSRRRCGPYRHRGRNSPLIG